MILRISRRLIQEIHRLATQLHPLAFKPNVAYPRLVLFTLAPIVLEKQVQRSYRIEERAFDGDFLDVVALCELEYLGWWEIGGSAEVEVVAVDEEFEGLGCAGGGGGAEEDAVEADLGCEAILCLAMAFGVACGCETHGTCINSCSSASLFNSGSGSNLSVHVFCTIFVPDLGSDSLSVLMAEKSICS